jgi:hypothetical protein
MHTVSHSLSESNQPHTCQSWAVALADSPDAEMQQHEVEKAAIEAERAQELADLARIEAEQDRQQLADATDLDFVDYIGTSKIHTLIDLFEKHDAKGLKAELARLVVERDVYRRLSRINARMASVRSIPVSHAMPAARRFA